MRGINNDDARYDPNGAGSLTYALTLPAGLICDLPTLALTGTPQARHETTQQNKPGFARNSGFWFFAKTKRASVTGTESREQMTLGNVPLVIHVRARSSPPCHPCVPFRSAQPPCACLCPSHALSPSSATPVLARTPQHKRFYFVGWWVALRLSSAFICVHPWSRLSF